MTHIIETADYRLHHAETYMSKTGQSMVVVLYPAHHGKPRRVYLKKQEIVYVEKPQHLVNIAMHKSRGWLDSIASDLWFIQVVNACLPLRSKCKSLLVAISKTAKIKYGEKYWRTDGGRKMLNDELRLIGIKMPLFGSWRNYLKGQANES